MKRLRLAFLFLSLLCLMLTACGGTPSTIAPTPALTGPQKIKVVIGDFYIDSPVTTFTTGTHYQFVITNVGTHYHNFLIMPPMQTMTMTIADLYNQALGYLFNIGPHQTATLDFTFDHTAPPGMLELSCHYGGHYEAGMHQPIVVNAAPGASVSPYPASQASTKTGLCDPITTAKVTNEAYTPATISLKAGDTLTIIRTDSQSYTPTTIPHAGIRLTSGDPNNITSILFPFAGTFTLSSQEYPEAKATVSVSKIVGTTCGMTPVATVTFNANYADLKNTYFFIPTQVTIKKGQRITLSNLVDRVLSFRSTPDIGLGKIKVLKDWGQDLEFTAGGTYTISCVQFPNQKFTVTVQGTS